MAIAARWDRRKKQANIGMRKGESWISEADLMTGDDVKVKKLPGSECTYTYVNSGIGIDG